MEPSTGTRDLQHVRRRLQSLEKGRTAFGLSPEEQAEYHELCGLELLLLGYPVTRATPCVRPRHSPSEGGAPGPVAGEAEAPRVTPVPSGDRKESTPPAVLGRAAVIGPPSPAAWGSAGGEGYVSSSCRAGGHDGCGFGPIIGCACSCHRG